MKKDIFYVLFALLISPTLQADTALLHTETLSGNVPIIGWKTLRDHRLVKQDQDYSCGAASIATILTEYYRYPITEATILAALDEVSGKGNEASFADMGRILPRFGFKGIGLATSWEQLTTLKAPVIVYVSQRNEDHFTVVSGISENQIRLADPSLGNRILTRGQFKEIWETRKEQGLEGKMLAILPKTKAMVQRSDPSFFVRPAFTPVPTEILTVRNQLPLHHTETNQ